MGWGERLRPALTAGRPWTKLGPKLRGQALFKQTSTATEGQEPGVRGKRGRLCAVGPFRGKKR